MHIYIWLDICIYIYIMYVCMYVSKYVCLSVCLVCLSVCVCVLSTSRKYEEATVTRMIQPLPVRTNWRVICHHVSPEANSWWCIMARGEFFILSECWLPGWWCNNHLEKYEFVNGKDDIPYMKWKIKNVWNHQPAPHCSSFFFWTFMKNRLFVILQVTF